MDEERTATAELDPATAVELGGEHEADADAEVVDELLVEEISIDGMCGVY